MTTKRTITKGLLTAPCSRTEADRSARRVSRQSTFARFEELLRPAVIHRSSYAFSAAELGDVLLAAQSLQHDADLFFRRIMPAGLTPNVLQTCSAGALSGPDFCFIFAPCGYDEPEILPS